LQQDYSKEERKELARKSRLEPPCFGNAERQKVSQELHDVMLAAVQVLATGRAVVLLFDPVAPSCTASWDTRMS